MRATGNPVSITRMELLARKAQIDLAVQGRDLLEQKRTALMKELLRTVSAVMEQAEALQDAAAHAHEALARAEAVAGVEAVRSAALAAQREFLLEVRTKSVMGVRVPDVEQKRVARSLSGRGFSYVGTSLTIDEAAEAFEQEVEVIIRLAESELRLVRLTEEIQHTSRRLNALDHLLLPRLEAERDMIQTALDERERADHFRLKLMKRILERKRGAEERP